MKKTNFTLLTWKLTLLILSLNLVSCGNAPSAHNLTPSVHGEPNLGAWKAHHLRSSEICVVTHHDNKDGYAAETTKNHEEYSSRFGYSYKFLTGNISGDLFKDPSRSERIFREGLYWQKVTAVKQELARSECRWVMWIDADVLFTNLTHKIEEVLQNYAYRSYQGNELENHLILSAEEVIPSVSVNAGVFLVKNSQWSKDFFNHVENAYPFYKDHGLPEQDFLQDAAYQRIKLGDFTTYLYPNSNEAKFENLLQYTVVIPQRIMNSFHRFHANDGTAQWQEGDYIAHLSGSSSPQRLEMITKLKARIVR